MTFFKVMRTSVKVLL